MSRFTHITVDGTPVIMVNEKSGLEGHSLVQTRTAIRINLLAEDVFPMGSAEAQEILAEVTGQDEAAAVEEVLEDRVILARWAKCLGNARDTLAEAIGTVLGTQGVDGPGHGSRRTLERALIVASDDLADFSR